MRNRYYLPVLGGVVVIIVTVYQVFYILARLGQSILEVVILSTPTKFCISLYLFLGLSSLVLALLGTYILLRGLTKTSAKALALSACLALVSPLIPSMYDFSLQTIPMIVVVLGVGLIAAGAIFAGTTPSMSTQRKPMSKGVELATIVLFSALYVIIMVFSWQTYPISSPVGGYLRFGDVAVFVAALFFGCKVGGLVGVLGAVGADFYLAYPYWYISILAHGLEGVTAGLAREKSFALQVVACIVGGLVMASVYFFVNVFLKGYPVAAVAFVQDLVGQAGISIVLGSMVTMILRKTLFRSKLI